MTPNPLPGDSGPDHGFGSDNRTFSEAARVGWPQ
jgi:hypothetical protein